ncbi:MAG: hypothetical protein QOF57_925 [Frankiaceae bacterium]|jgi:hypothetical protein|nr:hypothetical protein [Frankiaceae bacterium]
MRVMVLMPASKETEAGEMPSTEILTAMTAFNEELVKAGMMLAGEGLHATNKAKRVVHAGDGKTTVVDGPFTESKELIAGFWIWQVKSLDEAVEWAKRVPTGALGQDTVSLEIRPLIEAEDFGDAFTPELQRKEEQLRSQVAAQQ